MVYGWMDEFADAVTDARLRRSLQVALAGRRPLHRFKDTLDDHPHERERWCAFRDQRLCDATREWLADQGIEPTTAPPRRRA